jgi:hypothetical protein
MKMEQPRVRVSPVQIEQNMDYPYHAWSCSGELELISVRESYFETYSTLIDPGSPDYASSYICFETYSDRTLVTLHVESM